MSFLFRFLKIYCFKVQQLIFLVWLIFFLGLGCRLAYSDDRQAANLPEPPSKRSLFVRAENAFNKGDLQQYHTLKKQLTHYALFPYLLFAEYERRIPSLSTEDFQKFMSSYPDTPLANQLRSLFLQHKAKQENWQAYLQAYIPTEDLGLQCHFLWAELQFQKDKNTVLNQVQALWLKGEEPPKACQKLFSRWETSSHMTRPLWVQQIKRIRQVFLDHLSPIAPF